MFKPMSKLLLLAPFYRRGNGGMERLNKLLKHLKGFLGGTVVKESTCQCR